MPAPVADAEDADRDPIAGRKLALLPQDGGRKDKRTDCRGGKRSRQETAPGNLRGS